MMDSCDELEALAWLFVNLRETLDEYKKRVIQSLKQENSKRMSKLLRTYQSQGRRVSSIPPFGWRLDPLDDRRLVSDAEQQQVIERIKVMRAKGMKYCAIADQLELEGIRASKDRWNARLVARICKREGDPTQQCK